MSFKISIQVDNNNNPQKKLESAVQHLERTFIVNLDYKEPIITPKAIRGRPQKLSNEQRQEIRTLFKNGEIKTSLMNEINVSHSLISNI